MSILRKMYVEFSPCGLCDYLMKEYPQKMIELAKAPSSYRKLAEKMSKRNF